MSDVWQLIKESFHLVFLLLSVICVFPVVMIYEIFSPITVLRTLVGIQVHYHWADAYDIRQYIHQSNANPLMPPPARNLDNDENDDIGCITLYRHCDKVIFKMNSIEERKNPLGIRLWLSRRAS